MTKLNLKMMKTLKRRRKMGMKKIIDNRLYLLIVIVLLFGIGSKMTLSYKADLPVFTKEELVKYDGNDSNIPVYIAFDGLVYDVTTGRENFYDPGKPYHFLAGRDSTAELNFAGGNMIKSRYKVVGRYQ
jgi:predicted heme/steroid binding protein